MNGSKKLVQLLLAAALACASTARAQTWTVLDMSGEDAVTADQLAAALLSTGEGGPGVTITNVRYVGAAVASGAFTTTDPNVLGFSAGVLLTSGCAGNVVGPDTVENMTCVNDTVGDATLDALISGTSHDAAVLEFDFVPDADVISFQYVFASEEYHEYANSGFNDVFAFFINGVNHALLPGTSIPVSINNVNGGNPLGYNAQHPEYYRHNLTLDTQMDGLTVLLSLEAPVVRNAINHMKLAIADVGDFSWDSVVFLKAGSLIAAPADTDGDGVPDSSDNCPTTPNADQADVDGNGVGDVCDPGTSDPDGDGVPSYLDNCPAIANPGQGDFDGDAIGDACDADADGDGVLDTADNCLMLANPDQADADGDGQGDACDVCPQDELNDGDQDGVCGDLDVCPADPDPAQADADDDGQGDVCDPDDDGDGVADGSDNCPWNANASQADWDGDGVGDACESDTDGDGFADGEDACRYTDPGAVVNATGCSVADLCPCTILPQLWKNHGAYVSCVAKTAGAFVEEGLLTEEEKGAVVSAAAGSTCGKK